MIVSVENVTLYISVVITTKVLKGFYQGNLLKSIDNKTVRRFHFKDTPFVYICSDLSNKPFIRKLIYDLIIAQSFYKHTLCF